MTSIIKILPEHVASQIAAGEVIQRPASVVRELIDNSLDAGAGRIIVEIEKGGNSSIRVIDDGCGISKEDLPTALRRHATSKIEAAADLLSIQTYGFRGEALAAISSVSHVEIISRQPSEKQGQRLYAIGSEIQTIEPVGAPTGTSISVKEIFFNTPVRKKFLKSPTTEMERIHEIFIRVAICFPNLHLEIFHNGKRSRCLPPVPSVADRLMQIFGSDFLREMVAVDYPQDRIQIAGFTGKATVHRNTPADLYFFVNRRFVRDKLLMRALLEAYKASLPQRRYPVSFLFIDIPTDQIDVNVHPAKEEIRFRDERHVWSALYQAVRSSFETGNASVWISAEVDGVMEPPSLPRATQQMQEGPSAALSSADQPSPQPASPMPADQPSQSHVNANHGLLVEPPLEAGSKAGNLLVEPLAPRLPEPLEEPLFQPGEETLDEDEKVIEALNRAPLAVKQEKILPEVFPEHAHRLWRPVAQIFNSFIVAESGDQLGIFDQHALHERIQFEKFRAEYQSRSISSQSLLMPVIIEIPKYRVPMLQASIDLLATCGFEIQPFGDESFAVSCIPSDLRLGEITDFLLDALQDIAEQDSLVPLPDKAEKVLARMACRTAIKAGDLISMREMTDLLEKYREDPTLATCPHGRPPVWKMSRREIEKWFDR